MVAGLGREAGHDGVLQGDPAFEVPPAMEAELAVVEAIAAFHEGVGEVECVGELGLKETSEAEAQLHHQHPRWAPMVAG